jgi:hypothetical protein
MNTSKQISLFRGIKNYTRMRGILESNNLIKYKKLMDYKLFHKVV